MKKRFKRLKKKQKEMYIKDVSTLLVIAPEKHLVQF